MILSPDCAASLIAKLLRARGVDRIFGLCGGHIMPMWMRCDAEGIRIIDTRDERAAVHMAQAHAEITGGLGVAMVTAGPALTNAMTGIANAHVSRVPLLILGGTPPRPQENRGALQDMDHTQLVRSVTRYARTIRDPDHVLRELDDAIARAFGEGGEPGPVFIEFATDTLRAEVPKAVQMEEHFRAKPRVVLLPAPDAVKAAVDLLWSAKRPLVISGRGAQKAGPELIRFLDRLGAAYLDTGESRGLVPDDHPSVVAATRGDCDNRSRFCQRSRRRRTDAARASGDESALPGERGLGVAHAQIEPEVEYARRRNSSRVRASSRKAPLSDDVTVREFCFCTPRIIMQRW